LFSVALILYFVSSGKSLFISRVKSRVEKIMPDVQRTTIRFMQKVCDFDVVMEFLNSDESRKGHPQIIHMDVTATVRNVFSLLC